jgi:hypothetical protein
LTIRRTALVSEMSCPKMRALPPSGSSSVESSRTSGRLPEPFWPSTAMHSPRRMSKVEPAQRLDADALAPVLPDELLA